MENTNLENKLKELVRNETAKEVFEFFSIRERHRKTTSIRKLYTYLIRVGSKIVPDDLDKLFKDLEVIGIGKMVKGQRFEWYYNVKDVGNFAIGNIPHLLKFKERRVVRRPVAPPVRVKLPQAADSNPVPLRRRLPGDLKHGDLIIMASTMNGELVPLSLNEISLINSRVNELKNKLG